MPSVIDRNLDIEIAHHIFGLTKTEAIENIMMIANYSRSMEAAFLVVTKVLSRHKILFQLTCATSMRYEWHCQFDTVAANGDSAPGVICLAALKFVERMRKI